MVGENDPLVPTGGSAFGVPARRERIIAILAEAYASNELEQREYEDRVGRAEQAQTLEQLNALIADFPAEAIARYGLPGAPEAQRAALAPTEIERAVAQLDGQPAPTRTSIFGDQRVTLYPEDRRVLRTVVGFGDTHLDLRPLSGQGGVFLLKVATFVGDTRITVPPGTRVDVRATVLIGDQTKKSGRLGGFLGRLGRRLGVLPQPPQQRSGPPGPVVVVTGFKLIGDVEIREE